MYPPKKLLLIALLFSTNVFSQIQDFTLQLTKTNETCSGNGSLTFTPSNQTSGAAVLYKIFMLPDVASPMAIQTQPYLGGLSAGEYLVTATQSLGNATKSAQAAVTIENQVAPFDFSISCTNEICATGGTIHVTPTLGVITSYEIISGPITRPLQSSGTFSNLPQGIYNIRVFNNCGVGKVKTYALVLINGELQISEPYYPEAISENCGFIRVNNSISATAGTIPYPVTVEHAFDMMDIAGEPITISQTFESGDPHMLEVSVVVPRSFYGNSSYSLKVTDDCNTVYNKEEMVLNNDVDFVITPVDAPCSKKYLTLATSKVAAPYTVTFLAAPQGFDAASFNANATGPVASPLLTFGDDNNTVPFGSYVMQLTDACGRSITKETIIELVKPVPSVDERNGCYDNEGSVEISFEQTQIVAAQIVAAPQAYSSQFPINVSAGINNQGNFAIKSLPIGTYTIQIKDGCGYLYDIEFEIPPFEFNDFKLRTRPACAEGYGALYAESSNQHLNTVLVLAAPASFGQQLPYDISDYIIWNGDLYKNDFPEGKYQFKLIDKCGVEQVSSINIEGYHPPQPGYIFSPQCAAFSVKVDDTSNGNRGATYWLQKYNPTTGKWTRPEGGVAYVEGAVPTHETGMRLVPGQERNNLTFSGKFRVLKKFETFGNKTTAIQYCVSVLGEFNYSETLDFDNAYTLACLGQPHDVYLDVTGNPVSYKIIVKDGQPYVQDNGQNNIFRNLAPAEYTFCIEDYCGNRIVKRFNVRELPSIAEATKPKDYVLCVDKGTSHAFDFNLFEKTAEVLGPLHSSMYTVTYHLSETDAESDINPLPPVYTSNGNGQMIYVRVEHNEIEFCHGVTSFALYVGERPEPRIITEGTICDNGRLALTADSQYSNYLWSTGETTRTIFVTEPGIYTLMVEKAYGNSFCDEYTEVAIAQSFTPEIKDIETKDWTEDQNMITIVTEQPGAYQYSIDGINFQDSNVFTGLPNGLYKVTVKDAAGCGAAVQEVVLLNYPKFFTPNGDGVNETWRIKYSTYEPHMKINIFDRFGKVVSSFGPNDEGWNGTFNGAKLPSTDYWFVVTREDGRELKGHFSMIR